MAGGQVGMGKDDFSKDILMYDGAEDKWTKVGDLCYGRAFHAISLVPAVVEITNTGSKLEATFNQSESMFNCLLAFIILQKYKMEGLFST